MTTLSRSAITAGAYEDLLVSRLVHILGSSTFDPEPDATLNPIFTVPAGKKAVITSVMVHSNTVSLAGMTDVDLGGGVAAITPAWKNNFNISSITGVDSLFEVALSGASVMIDGDDATPADSIFGMLVVTGSTLAGLITVDALGYLIDS